MRVDVSQYIRNIRKSRKLRHRVAAFLTAMSMVVSMAVFWQLRGVGTAMEQESTCTKQEHTHTDKCYEMAVVCGQDEQSVREETDSAPKSINGTPESTDGGSEKTDSELEKEGGEQEEKSSAHVHTDDCYERRLICGLDEHTHSSECTSDTTADTETQEVWEQTLPKKLTKDIRNNIALVAQSQLGYSESRTNFHFADDGQMRNGYTRYGQWYGSPYSEWNSLFTYFCMYYAGVDRQSVPYGSGIAAWTEELEKKALLIDIKDAKLQKGDILIIDTDLDGKPDRSAVVSQINEKDGKTSVKTIEGNVEGKVAYGSYSLSDKQILSCVNLENANGDLLFEQVSASGVKVTAKAEKRTFPDKTTMTVKDISKSEAVKTAQAAAEKDKKVADAVAVDITFKDAKGKEIEPAEGRNVQVQIKLPDKIKFDKGEYSLLHVTDKNTVQKVENATVTAEGAEFESDSFSIFVLASNGEYVEPGQLIMLNGSAGNNSEDNPYVIQAGEKITVRYSGEYKGAGRFTVFNNDFGENNAFHHLQRTVDDSSPDGADYVEAVFTGDVAGKCRIAFLKTDAWSTANIAEDLWVQVESPMSVKSYYNDKDKDHIKEYLGGYDLPNKDGYVPNSNNNRIGRPYLLRVGDRINVRSNSSGDFELVGSAGTYLRRLETPDYTGYVTFQAIAPTQTTVIVEGQTKTQDFSVLLQHEAGGVVNDSLYVRVYSKTSTWFTHCDMEIADDGKYTLTEFTENGKTERVYKAYVTNINADTVLRDASGNVVNTMPKEAYRKLGYPGQTQYEMTSAYYVGNFSYQGDNDLLHIAKDGKTGEYKIYKNLGTEENPNFIEWDPAELGVTDHPHLYTEKHEQYGFDVNRIASVDFNVQITLYPYEEITYTKDDGNKYTVSDRTSIAGEDPEVIDNKLVHFEGQTLVDAFNKCPLDNGLDFTFMPEGALVKLQAGKKLANEGVTADKDKFEFELRSTQYQAAKVGTTYGGQQLPDNTFDVTDVFPDATERDVVKAYRIIKHDDPMGYDADSFNETGFIAAMQTALPQQSTGWMEISQLIDGCKIGTVLTGQQQKLYTALAGNIIGDGVAAVNGKFTDLPNGHYLFVNDHVEATAKNDENGKVTFPYLAFSEQDKGKTFTYYMNEVPDPDDPDVQTYDSKTVEVKITIGNDMSVTVKYAGGDDYPVFKNTLKEYQLPNTGGPGIVPYITFGTVLILSAMLLLVRKKRREAG